MREELYNKLAKEYLEYEDKLKQLTIQEIIEKSYETAIKNEMTYYFDPESDYFNDDQIRILNKLDNPLNTLYQDWLDNDFGIGEDVRLSIDEFSYSLIEHEEMQKAKDDKER